MPACRHQTAPVTGPPSPADDALSGEARRALPLLVVGRFASNIGVRFPFSFVAPLARGLGIPVDTLGLLLGARELTGLAAPALGRWSDRRGRRVPLGVGLVAMGVAMAVSGVAPGLPLFTIGLLAFGVGKAAHDVASNGWIGDHVPWRRRGRITGVVELSWAAALLVGMPLLGWLIEATSWRWPFFVTGALCTALGTALLVVLRRDHVPHHAAVVRRRRRPGPATVALMVTTGCMALGMQLVTVVFGAWLEDGFGFSVAAVGTASILLGLGELVGSGSSARFTDVLGKRRSVTIGTAVMIPCLVLLGPTEGNALAAVGLFAVVSAGFEFGFVSSLPMFTELEPEDRAGTIGLAFATFTALRAVGTVAGAFAYVHLGMTPVALAAALAVAAGLVVLRRWVAEPGEPAAVPG